MKALEDGFERVLAAPKDFPPGQVDLQTPAVSPDGSRVAFTRFLSPVKTGVVLISPDGASTRELPGLSGVWSAYAFSRDGRSLYTVREPEAGGRHRLVAAEVATGRERVLAELSIDESTSFQTPANYGLRFTLSPDGESLSATVAHVKSDIWMLEGFPGR